MMLDSNRIDAFVGEKNVVNYYSFKIKLKDKIRIAGHLSKKGYLYVGFSPKNPQANLLASIVDKGILTLRKSGDLEKIMKEYGL